MPSLIRIGLLLCGVLSSWLVKAQLNNQVFEDRFTVVPAQNQQIRFQFYSLSFLRNTEYFNSIVKGRTLFGNLFNPKLIYQPSAHVRIEAGLYAWKDFGNSTFSQLAPTFTVKIKKDSLQFLFGTLEGSLNHRLIEPLYQFDRVITNRLENGVQLLYQKPRFYLDTWIDWQRMIYEQSPFQEEIVAGTHSYYDLVTLPSWKLSAIFQSTIKHQGGQINTGGGTISTTFNTALGLRFRWNNAADAFLKSFSSENHWVHLQSDNKALLFRQGNGLYLNTWAHFKPFDLMLSYWNGHNYASPIGGDLYQSLSQDFNQPTYTEPNRKLLIVRLIKEWPVLPNLWMSFRFEPYFDLNNGLFEHAEGLYLVYKGDWKLGKKEPKN
ncbi:MAG: hypothetical protein U0Y10_21830 [Spirosomataceae bacterium]